MLAVKLALPARPPLFLARERLRQQLVHWVQYRVIVVSAPAGYGKSMLAADFLNSLAGEPVRLAWLSLDEDDDDPARFVAALAAALAISQEGGGGHIPPLQLLLQLLDRLIAQGTTVMLALDDLHRLKNPAVHKLLAFAIEHSPAFLHWFLLSRHKPALGLSRLRLQKQVLEIGSSDLRLERAELEQYLLLAGQDKLSTASIDLLENRMQGWIAGVRLALLSLHGQTLQGSSMLEHLHGDNRLFAEYLTEEVLAQQTESMHHFLLQCSILEQLHPALCQEVTGQPDAGQLLEQTWEQQLFLDPLSHQEQWYALHQLFRELLARSLRRQYSAAAIQQLYLRASSWYVQQGQLVPALRCLLDSGAAHQAATLLEQYSRQMLLDLQLDELNYLFSLLPVQQVEACPQLLIDRVWLFFSLDAQRFFTEIDRMMQLLKDPTALSRPQHDELVALQLVLRFGRQERDGLYTEIQQVLKQIAPESSMAVGTAHVLALLTVDSKIHCASAHQHAQLAIEAFDSINAAGGQLHVLWQQALLARNLGDLQGCLARCQAPLGGRVKPQSGIFLDYHLELLCLAGEVHYWRNELDEARCIFQQALQLAQSHHEPFYQLQAQLQLQLCNLADGLQEPAHSLVLVQELWQAGATRKFIPKRAELVYWQMLRWLALGDRGRLWQSFRQLELDLDTLSPNADYRLWGVLLTAYVVYGHELERVSPLLQQQQQQASQCGFVHQQIQLTLLSASLQQTLGKKQAARRCLQQALPLAKSTKAVRLLWTLPDLLPLLASIDNAAAFSAQPAAQKIYPLLTSQDRQVLRLMIEGWSIAEIARQMMIAPNTVKWYQHRIYQQLKVRNRRQAVEMGARLIDTL